MMLSYVLEMDGVRKKILEIVEDRKTNLKEASLAIGRNHAYLHQYIHNGTPTKLKEDDRLKLASFLDVLESEIMEPSANREPATRLSAPSTSNFRPQTDEHVQIMRYANPMGAGVPIASESDIVLEGLRFRKDWLRKMTSAPFDKLKTLYISGDSMEPKVCDGDLILVDCCETKPKKKEIYALRYDGGVMAKYVTADHLRKLYILSSENPLYKPFEAEEEEVEIIGRLLWRAGKV